MLNQKGDELIDALFNADGKFFQFTCRNCGGGDRGRVAIYRPFGEVSLSLNRTVTCLVLKANDRRTSCPCHDEFRGPRSDYVRQILLKMDKWLKRRKFNDDNSDNDNVRDQVNEPTPAQVKILLAQKNTLSIGK
ncbi:uncharacterized protein TNCV_1462321 [Trichonephila clavipes]|nr:uncharacterized protein TNCV_1462321 [Trichonephila clavipes]